MILCDIGNTHFHFYHRGRVWRETPKTLSPKKEQIFYISVNPNYEKELNKFNSCINLAPYFNLQTKYDGLGIDRISACMGMRDGVIVDAGSAITIDVMEEGRHLGGYILLGISSFIRAYSSISPSLDVMPSFSLDLNPLPQNTKEAIGQGILKSVIGMIEKISQGKKIYFCGGDGKFLSKFFADSIYDELMVFKGMQRALENYQNGKNDV